MTEEFIPRDTPIYCIVANNEKDLDRARQTRDVWTKRWGYTNFIIQERISLNTYVKNIIPESVRKREFTDQVIEAMQEISHYYAANVFYLIEKLKSRPHNSIIIHSNTILQNDLPKHYLDNDISFFKLNPNGNVNFRDGIMVSQSWCRSLHSYIDRSFFYLPSEQMVHAAKNFHFQIENVPPFEMIQILDNCKHNLKELTEKTQEEMHGFRV